MSERPHQIWKFDRYVNGVLMAEGVEISRAASFDDASVSAARLASRGPNGEVPVLVLIPADALAEVQGMRADIATLRECAKLEMERAEAAEAKLAALVDAGDGCVCVAIPNRLAMQFLDHVDDEIRDWPSETQYQAELAVFRASLAAALAAAKGDMLGALTNG